jgi:hypothetical protein
LPWGLPRQDMFLLQEEGLSLSFGQVMGIHRDGAAGYSNSCIAWWLYREYSA